MNTSVAPTINIQKFHKPYQRVLRLRRSSRSPSSKGWSSTLINAGLQSSESSTTVSTVDIVGDTATAVGERLRRLLTTGSWSNCSKSFHSTNPDHVVVQTCIPNYHILCQVRFIFGWKVESIIALLLLVCVSFTIIGQPRNSVLIRRV